MSSEAAYADRSIAISVESLTKRYEIYARPQDRLRQMVLPRLQKMLRRVPSCYYREFWAIRDIGFSVRRGEAVGIIGRNGSGKSTLLQVICGTLTATGGEVKASGRVAALLELGAGFNPEFTGRENVFLSGLVYGIADDVLKQRYQSIVDFSEIGEHIDQPVKTYSSGMYVRLAFAVAAFCDPEILIVDEALSVGDVYFQRKCFKRIEEMRQTGCTLLFVTHSIDTLLQLCDRGIVLDDGRMVFDGETKPAVAEYLRRVFGSRGVVSVSEDPALPPAAPGSEVIPIGDDRAYLVSGGSNEMFALRPGYNRDEVRLGDGGAAVVDFLVKGQRDASPIVHARESFCLMLRYAFNRDAERLIFGVQIRTREGIIVYSANTFTAQNQLYKYAAGSVVVGEFHLRNSLLPGQYFVTVGISRFDEHGVEIGALDRRVDAILLTVLGGTQHTNGFVDMELNVRICNAASAPSEEQA